MSNVKKTMKNQNKIEESRCKNAASLCFLFIFCEFCPGQK
ncbi:hypothetical protein T190607A01A_10692 [Tenacibaculum sp. 190524A05c]|uniref:Uncharacterized protein n=1 Tax=Tenacibaculum platacis TaxID=3137852 RepID=A0ABM9NTH3_9FLAO